MIIVSNRLPLKVEKKDNQYSITPSAGGLATGLKSYHKDNDSIWIGWPGIISEDIDDENKISSLIKKEQCLPVFLNEKEIEGFYDGYSNATLWPLFHYFTDNIKFKRRFWKSYYLVNEMFAEAVVEAAPLNDTVWVHDYQLLLVPKMLREKRPDLKIGFFLHIPFPSYEVFRILPQREELINGLLGADLIGFHTYDYARHFNSSVKRLLGHEIEFNCIHLDNRQVMVDVFPMGIDYEKFELTAMEIQSKPIQERSKQHQDIDRFLLSEPDRHLILSIDRLDYSKGIPERLKAFKYFLQTYPEYHEKVSLVMLTVPSREDVEEYQNLKTEVDLLVGRINGEFGTLNWNPVIYFYRSLPFTNLIELYCSADIALLTPLRDGMNLVAKEYVACKTKGKGVLILSEMAGAAKELGEAIAVNPNNIEQVAKAIYSALTIQEDERTENILAMQKRIKRYDIHKWASEFLNSLNASGDNYEENIARKLSKQQKDHIFDKFAKAKNRTLFLDYDGTLQRFFNKPSDAKPEAELYELLDKISNLPNTNLVIISGRDQKTFEKWFGTRDYHLIAEHGAWKRIKQGEWTIKRPIVSDWKDSILPVLESYVDRTPGSLIEDKTYSLVWHYRKADIELGGLRALELVTDVSDLIINQELEILEGNKVIEIKVSGINKGIAATEFLLDNPSDFILAIGDDWTDEFLFKELPESAFTIKVGKGNSAAKNFVDNYTGVRQFLSEIILTV